MRILVGLALGLLLTACAQMQPQPGDLQSQVEALLQQQRYGEALDLVESQVSDTSPASVLALQARVREQAADFEAGKLAEAGALVRQTRWRQAEALFDEALSKYPQSERLGKAFAEFQARRQDEIEDISLQLLVLRGEWLTRSTPLFREIENQGPTSEWRKRITAFNADRRDTAAELHRCGQKALHQRAFGLATRCLALSAALDPNDAVRSALAMARQRQESERSRTAAAQQQREQEDTARRNAEMAAQCRQALEAGNLAQANTCLQQLDRQAPYSAEIAELRPQIEAAVDQHVRTGMDLGRQHYSSGQIEQALKVWEPLLKLQPDNLELQTHVERARRVLRKLRQLGG